MRQQRIIIIAFAAVILICGALAVYLYLAPTPEPEVRPFSELAVGYTPEDAAADGCLVTQGAKIISGKGAWRVFLSKSQAGKPATIRKYESHLTGGIPDGGYTVLELIYDGERYRLRYFIKNNGEESRFFEEEYKFLVADKYIQRTRCSEYYHLADYEDVSYDEYFRNMLSSIISDKFEKYRNFHTFYMRDLALSELREDEIEKFIASCGLTLPEGKSLADVGALLTALQADPDMPIPKTWSGEDEENFARYLKGIAANYVTRSENDQ